MPFDDREVAREELLALTHPGRRSVIELAPDRIAEAAGADRRPPRARPGARSAP